MLGRRSGSGRAAGALVVAVLVVLLAAVVAARTGRTARTENGRPRPEPGGRSLRVDRASAVQSAIDARCRSGGVVQLSGTYVTPGTVVIEGCRNLTVRGPAVLDGSAPGRLRTDRHVAIRASSDVVVEDLTVVGGRCGDPPCPGDDDPAFNERQHGFEIAASDRVELRRVRVLDVWGDAVYVTAKTFSAGGADRTPHQIAVRDSYVDNTGRQGVSASGVDGMVVERTVLRRVGLAALDFEAESGGAAAVTVRDNTVLFPRNGTLHVSCDSGPGGAPLNRGPFVLAANRVQGGPLQVNPFGCALPPGLVVLEGNVEDLPADPAKSTEPAGRATPTTDPAGPGGYGGGP